ncbi:MAG: hypothetical protein ACLQVJ_14390 [Syntrophobacteraceae bacterium]
MNFFLRNIPEELWAEAKVICHNEGMSLRTWIITLVQREVKAAKISQKRKLIITTMREKVATDKNRKRHSDGEGLDGTGVPQDYGEAEKRSHKAAEQGDAEAQTVLGWPVRRW